VAPHSLPHQRYDEKAFIMTSSPPTSPEGPGVPSAAMVASRITVALVDKALIDLQRTQERTGLSKTDIVNRAISLYHFIDTELDSGGELQVRRPTGETYIVKLM
jgi:hypothetical protein